MTNFRSLTGGFFSADPNNKSVPVSIRTNNPGALNVAPWIRSFPGYVSDYVTTPGNSTVVFETPENGVAAWYELMRKYHDGGADTVKEIITRYGGGQDYSTYYKQVAAWTGLAESQVIKLQGDDLTLLKFAKAMFRYESGVVTPLADSQIQFGFNLARGSAEPPIATDPTAPPVIISPPIIRPAPTPTPPPPPVNPLPPPPAPAPIQQLPWWVQLLYWLFGRPTRPQPPAPIPPAKRVLKNGMVGNDVLQLQRRLYEIGFTDIVADGDFGDVTETSVRAFQTRNNLDPDGEVGELTWIALNSPNAPIVKPPLNPPSPIKYGEAPPWYKVAESLIGFHETGENRGIEKLIAGAHCGSLGDPWCAIGINYELETSNVPGSRSAMARSFETNKNFVKLSGPALGAITTMWRGSLASGQGHVFLYDGENSKGVRGIGANEDDQVKRSFHERSRITGYWWPKSVPLPVVKPIVVTDSGTTSGSET